VLLPDITLYACFLHPSFLGICKIASELQYTSACVFRHKFDMERFQKHNTHMSQCKLISSPPESKMRTS
jgi:hypothetical protein